MPAPRSPSSKYTPAGPALVPSGRFRGKPPVGVSRAVLVIGSKPQVHLQLLSDQVSQNHALLLQDEDGGFYIRDLGSRAHVLVNDKPVLEADLRHNDKIQIGPFTFRLSALTGASSPTAPPRRRAVAPEHIPALEVAGEDIPLRIDQRVFVIGRKSQSDAPLIEESVSTIHAVIFLLNGKYFIRDLGSRTGTFVNGAAIRQVELRFGDHIRIGQTDMRFAVSEGHAVSAVPDDDLENLVGTAALAPDAEVPGLEPIESPPPMDLSEPGESRIPLAIEPEAPAAAAAISGDDEPAGTAPGEAESDSDLSDTQAMAREALERDMPRELPAISPALAEPDAVESVDSEIEAAVAGEGAPSQSQANEPEGVSSPEPSEPPAEEVQEIESAPESQGAEQARPAEPDQSPQSEMEPAPRPRRGWRGMSGVAAAAGVVGIAGAAAESALTPIDLVDSPAEPASREAEPAAPPTAEPSVAATTSVEDVATPTEQASTTRDFEPADAEARAADAEALAADAEVETPDVEAETPNVEVEDAVGEAEAAEGEAPDGEAEASNAEDEAAEPAEPPASEAVIPFFEPDTTESTAPSSESPEAEAAESAPDDRLAETPVDEPAPAIDQLIPSDEEHDYLPADLQMGGAAGSTQSAPEASDALPLAENDDEMAAPHASGGADDEHELGGIFKIRGEGAKSEEILEPTQPTPDSALDLEEAAESAGQVVTSADAVEMSDTSFGRMVEGFTGEQTGTPVEADRPGTSGESPEEIERAAPFQTGVADKVESPSSEPASVAEELRSGEPAEVEPLSSDPQGSSDSAPDRAEPPHDPREASSPSDAAGEMARDTQAGDLDALDIDIARLGLYDELDAGDIDAAAKMFGELPEPLTPPAADQVNEAIAAHPDDAEPPELTAEDETLSVDVEAIGAEDESEIPTAEEPAARGASTSAPGDTARGEQEPDEQATSPDEAFRLQAAQPDKAQPDDTQANDAQPDVAQADGALANDAQAEEAQPDGALANDAQAEEAQPDKALANDVQADELVDMTDLEPEAPLGPAAGAITAEAIAAGILPNMPIAATFSDDVEPADVEEPVPAASDAKTADEESRQPDAAVASAKPAGDERGKTEPSTGEADAENLEQALPDDAIAGDDPGAFSAEPPAIELIAEAQTAGSAILDIGVDDAPSYLDTAPAGAAEVQAEPAAVTPPDEPLSATSDMASLTVGVDRSSANNGGADGGEIGDSDGGLLLGELEGDESNGQFGLGANQWGFLGGLPLELPPAPAPPPTFGRVGVSFGDRDPLMRPRGGVISAPLSPPLTAPDERGMAASPSSTAYEAAAPTPTARSAPPRPPSAQEPSPPDAASSTQDIVATGDIGMAEDVAPSDDISLTDDISRPAERPEPSIEPASEEAVPAEPATEEAATELDETRPEPTSPVAAPAAPRPQRTPPPARGRSQGRPQPLESIAVPSPELANMAGYGAGAFAGLTAPVDVFSQMPAAPIGDPFFGSGVVMRAGESDAAEPGSELPTLLPKRPKGRVAISPQSMTHAAGPVRIVGPAAPAAARSVPGKPALPNIPSAPSMRVRRRRFSRGLVVWALLGGMLASMIAAVALVQRAFAPRSQITAELHYPKFANLTPSVQQQIAEDQLKALRSEEVRIKARNDFAKRSDLNKGFLQSPEAYAQVMADAQWPDKSKGTLVLVRNEASPEDGARIESVLRGLYSFNAARVESNESLERAIARMENDLKRLQERIDANDRALRDRGAATRELGQLQVQEQSMSLELAKLNERYSAATDAKKNAESELSLSQRQGEGAGAQAAKRAVAEQARAAEEQARSEYQARRDQLDALRSQISAARAAVESGDELAGDQAQFKRQLRDLANDIARKKQELRDTWSVQLPAAEDVQSSIEPDRRPMYTLIALATVLVIFGIALVMALRAGGSPPPTAPSRPAPRPIPVEEIPEESAADQEAEK